MQYLAKKCPNGQKRCLPAIKCKTGATATGLLQILTDCHHSVLHLHLADFFNHVSKYSMQMQNYVQLLQNSPFIQDKINYK